MDCKHENFLADVTTNRLHEENDSKITNFLCEVKLSCVDCGQRFRFRCPDVGLMFDKPSISADGTELRVYIEPTDGSLQGSARPPEYAVQASRTPPKHSEN